uniref:Crotamine-Var-4 n=1 Tax=Varanus glauerti TaxID=169841 RepID=M9T7B7_VARGA|nr:crotamine-Var-4 [Varanus glauerti]
MKTLLLLCVLVFVAFQASAHPKPDEEPEPLQVADGGAPGMEGGTEMRGNSAWCGSRGGKCYLILCPRGTGRIGKCSTMYVCCK